jgi:hypothetical protein
VRSTGQPLNTDVLAEMESCFGRPFGHVRIHDDAKAAESAQAVEALAYTVGHNIVFAAGRYAPQTMSGKKLLAHELTHVLQQSCGAGPVPVHSDSSEIVRRQLGEEDPEKRIVEIEAELNRSSPTPELTREYNRLAARLRPGVSKPPAQTPEATSQPAQTALAQGIPVGLSYQLVGVQGGGPISGTLPPDVLSALGGVTAPGEAGTPLALSAIGGGGPPIFAGEPTGIEPLTPGLLGATGRSVSAFVNPLPGNVPTGAPDVYTRFFGPESVEGFFAPGRLTLGGDVRPRLFQGTAEFSAERESAFRIFQQRGISYAKLSELSRRLRAGGVEGLTAEESALFQQVTQIHAEVAGATPASPLLSLTELSPETALQRLKPTATSRAYIVRVRIDPRDVGRVNEILRRTGSTTEGLAAELEVVVAQDLQAAGRSAPRILSIVRNPAPAAPLAGATGSVLTWVGRGTVFLGAALTMAQVVTAEGPHRRETEGRALGSFAGGTVLGAFGTGFCIGAGIATGGAVLLLCGLAFGAAGAFGGQALGGAIGRAFD